jgi:hypothetical protein
MASACVKEREKERREREALWLYRDTPLAASFM